MREFAWASIDKGAVFWKLLVCNKALLETNTSNNPWDWSWNRHLKMDLKNLFKQKRPNVGKYTSPFRFPI